MNFGREIQAENNAASCYRPWSQLPIDLLRIISRNVTDIIDYIQFRSVCSSWRSAAELTHFSPQLQVPLLLLPHDTASSTRSFYNLSLGKLYSSDFPEIRNKTILGSSFGWLALIDSSDSSLFLWNPFTRSRIQLPPHFGFPLYLVPGAAPHVDERHRYYHGTSFAYPWKISMSTSPGNNDDCVAILLLSSSSAFAYCRLGDRIWTFLDSSLSSALDAVVFHEGSFFAFDCHAACAVVNLSSRKCKRIPHPGYSSLGFNVMIKDRDLIIVLCSLCFEGNEYLMRLGVYKLNTKGEKMSWSEVRSIGDSAIFLSCNHSSVVRALDFPGCREGCIYFSGIGFCGYQYEEHHPGVHYLSVFDVKANKCQPPLSCPLINTTKGSPMVSATWITPSLC